MEASSLTIRAPPRADNSYLNSLGDAERVIIEECNIEECSVVEGIHDNEGWHMSGERPESSTTYNVLMMETGDTE